MMMKWNMGRQWSIMIDKDFYDVEDNDADDDEVEYGETMIDNDR